MAFYLCFKTRPSAQMSLNCMAMDVQRFCIETHFETEVTATWKWLNVITKGKTCEKIYNELGPGSGEWATTLCVTTLNTVLLLLLYAYSIQFDLLFFAEIEGSQDDRLLVEP